MKKLALVALAFGFAGCASPGQYLTADKAGWYNVGTFGHADLYYCRANDDGKDAMPVCYEPVQVSPPKHSRQALPTGAAREP